MTLSITAYSTALFSTWYFIEELGVLFDAGDGVSAGLLQKSRKVKHAFISHADRDHLAGLIQFNQLNAREKLPNIYYPKDSGSFPAMAEFCKKFDPHVSGTQWRPITEEKRIYLNSNLIVESIRNGHIQAKEGITKSLSFNVFEIKRKLKEEFSTLSGDEIKVLIDTHGRDYTTYELKKPLISYSGDTPVEDWDRWKNANILIHEATFLSIEGEEIPDKAKNKHSKLEEVIEMVAQSNVRHLILGHFSTRYSKEQIEKEVKRMADKYQLTQKIDIIYPGEIKKLKIETNN